jgi:branched-subunit amino acid aminotransferase/4-amino-4-deoxychorismate lyase
MVAEATDLKRTAGGSITDAVAGWLAPQYLLAAREKLTATDGTGRFEVLRVFMHDWALLRRGDHAAARLQLDRDQLDWQRTNSQAQKEQEFREWIQRPEVRREFLPDQAGGIRPETFARIESELHLL